MATEAMSPCSHATPRLKANAATKTPLANSGLSLENPSDCNRKSRRACLTCLRSFDPWLICWDGKLEAL
jgi:hypothetical protein